jgi:hypothetical protein
LFTDNFFCQFEQLNFTFFVEQAGEDRLPQLLLIWKIIPPLFLKSYLCCVQYYLLALFSSALKILCHSLLPSKISAQTSVFRQIGMFLFWLLFHFSCSFENVLSGFKIYWGKIG